MLKEFDKNGDGKLDTGEVADLVEALVHERSINEVCTSTGNKSVNEDRVYACLLHHGLAFYPCMMRFLLVME